MRTTFLWTNLSHLWEMDLTLIRPSWERSSKLSKTSIQNLKDLLILEAVFCMLYITVLVKDLECLAKTWSAILGSSCHLQVQCCEERGLPATAGQLRSWYWDLPVARRSSLAKHWPCHSPCAWTRSVSLSRILRKITQGNWRASTSSEQQHY